MPDWLTVVLMVITIPVVLLVPLLIWAAVISGVHQLIRERQILSAQERRDENKKTK